MNNEYNNILLFNSSPLNKMTANLADDIFKLVFLNENENSDSNFTEICFQESNWQ